MKRMKRRVTADLHDFLSFPSTAGDGLSAAGSSFDGPFRSNIRSFLSAHAPLPPSALPHLLTWQIAFRIGERDGQDSSPETVVVLHVVEEDVSRSRSVYCDQCRVVGWSGHPVCGKRYHFIIRADSSSLYGYQQTCMRCGTLLHSLDSRCKSCNNEITTDEIEDWMHQQLENSTHLLHGVVHANGYGHLIRVNGKEGGSKFLSGYDIMDFWDRLCKMLRVRKVSVMDMSKKYGLEYRLLHAVTSGHSWYGDWGYEFGVGSFALTADAYRKAVSALSDMPLAPFFTHARTSRTHLQDVVSFYWSLSEQRLATVRDLFRFIMGLLHDIHKRKTRIANKKLGHGAFLLCQWSDDDIKRVESAMMKVLQAAGPRWVSWRTLKGAVCRAGSPELLDYCLKELGGKSLGGMVVHVRCNPETGVVQYSVACGNATSESNLPASVSTSADCLSEVHLLRDLKFLHEALLNPKTMMSYRPQSVRELAVSSAMKLLDCKHFVKDYELDSLKTPNPFAIRVLCQAELTDQPKHYTNPPAELIFLPITATVADLKMEAAKAFQEVYVLFKRFQAEKLLDFGQVDDSTNVKFLIGLDGSVRVAGRCLGIYGLHRFRMERGTDNWIVDCICGAKDDDGERMLACDECSVWQHTRCAGIHDFDTVPAKFICGRCKRLVVGKGSKGGQCCKDDMAAVMEGSNGFECLAMMAFAVGEG